MAVYKQTLINTFVDYKKSILELILGMLNRIVIKTKKIIFGKEWGVPNPFDSDIYLVSYPKSGNTWMRYLLAYAIWPELRDLDLVEMAAYIPNRDDRKAMQDPNSPCNHLKHRIIKEHAVYAKKAKQKIKRAICIVRDGRDAIVSYWYFCNQRDSTSIPFSTFLKMSANRSKNYGPWKDHVLSWINAPLEAKLIIRYEDMLKDPRLSLRNALEFAEVDVTDSAIELAVNRASFDSMRKLEKTKGFNIEQLKNVEFVRQGKSGSWVNTFEPGDLERFSKFHGGCIRELGYNW